VGVDARTAETIAKIAQDKIVIKGVTVQGVFEATVMSSNGVTDIKDAFMKAEEVAQEHEATVRIYTLGAPKYRVELTAEDYKKAEQALEHVVKFTQQVWAGLEGSISFTRE
jgi:translation initiation factor 2 subunit 1